VASHPAVGSSPTFARRLAEITKARETGIFLALVILCVLIALLTPNFLSVRNLLNIGRQVSLLGIMAIGMTFVLITREVDLSVGSIYALTGLASGMLIIANWPLIPAIVAGLALGAAVGFVNGWLSTYGRLPSFITTLGMLSVARGAALLMTNGEPVTINSTSGVAPAVLEQFFFLGQGRLWGIPMQLVFFVLFAVVFWVLLSHTTFGFRIYAVGGSDKASRLSGIRVPNVKIWAFTIMGTLSAVAGILGLAFLPSGQAGRTGVGLELDVIAAAIVGGASLSGGEGTILGTVLGVLIIGVLRNGLILLGISPFWQTTIIGAVIILAVGVDKWTEHRRLR
jgi:ribose transport system permease protein